MFPFHAEPLDNRKFLAIQFHNREGLLHLIGLPTSLDELGLTVQLIHKVTNKPIPLNAATNFIFTYFGSLQEFRKWVHAANEQQKSIPLN